MSHLGHFEMFEICIHRCGRSFPATLPAAACRPREIRQESPVPSSIRVAFPIRKSDPACLAILSAKRHDLLLPRRRPDSGSRSTVQRKVDVLPTPGLPDHFPEEIEEMQIGSTAHGVNCPIWDNSKGLRSASIDAAQRGFDPGMRSSLPLAILSTKRNDLLLPRRRRLCRFRGIRAPPPRSERWPSPIHGAEEVDVPTRGLPGHFPKEIREMQIGSTDHGVKCPIWDNSYCLRSASIEAALHPPSPCGSLQNPGRSGRSPDSLLDQRGGFRSRVPIWHVSQGQHRIMRTCQPADIPRLRAKSSGQGMSDSLHFLYYVIPDFL